MWHRSMQFQSGNLGATLVTSKPGEFGALRAKHSHTSIPLDLIPSGNLT